MLSSAKESNRYQKISDKIDHRTNGYKACKESMMHKTDVAVLLMKNALDAGVQADYVLMYTWFTTEPMLKEIGSLGMDVIGMVKQLKQRYTYCGKQYSELSVVTSCIKSKVTEWMLSQAAFIQALFGNICWES